MIKCNIQYIGKSQTGFNLRLNSHEKHIKSPNAISACQNLNRFHDTKFTTIGILNLRRTSSEIKDTENERKRELLGQTPPITSALRVQ